MIKSKGSYQFGLPISSNKCPILAVEDDFHPLIRRTAKREFHAHHPKAPIHPLLKENATLTTLMYNFFVQTDATPIK